MMLKFGGFIAILVSYSFSFTDAAVSLDRTSDFVVPPKNIRVTCTVTGEQFNGWYHSGAQIPTTTTAQIHVEKRSSSVYVLVVNQATVANGGTYDCRGTSGASRTFTLNIEFSAQHVEKTQYIRIGTNDQIKIDVVGVPQPSFSWKRDGVTVDFNTGRYSSSVRGTVSIRDVTKEDRGNYTLLIDQGSRSMNLKIEVIAFEPPIMVEVPLPTTRYLTAGFNTTFHCRARGYPPPTYKWLNKLNKEIDISNPRYILDGEYFHIVNIFQSDVGRYTCVASNVQYYQVNASAEIVEIYIRPTIQDMYLKDTIIERGETAYLDCAADGDPLPEVWWMRDGRFEMRQKQSKRRSLIYIQEASMTDMGRYQCLATNKARDQDGKIIVAEETMGLYLKSKPKVNDLGTQRKVYSYLGNPDPVFIRCNFEGYPFPNVTIWFDNIQIANGTDIAIFDIITNEMEDFGDYYCWSWNLHGSTNVTVQLLHAKAPTRPTNVIVNATCDSIHLTWDEPADLGGMEIVHYVIEFAGQRWNTEDTYPEYFIENLEHDKVYTVQIRARNKMGVGDHETITITTRQYCRPSHPIIWHPRQTVIQDTMFFLRWYEPEKHGGDQNIRYKVIINEDLEDEPYPIKEEEIGVTEYYVDELKFGMKYYIEVFAITQGGYSRPAIGLYEVDKRGLLISSSSPLEFKLVTMLLSSLLTFALTHL